MQGRPAHSKSFGEAGRYVPRSLAAPGLKRDRMRWSPAEETGDEGLRIWVERRFLCKRFGLLGAICVRLEFLRVRIELGLDRLLAIGPGVVVRFMYFPANMRD